MKKILSLIYNQLPPSARNLAATVRGVYLKSWRYDNNTDRRVYEFLQREYWNPEDWRKWREERLAYILQRAATQVPYYREAWAQRRKNGDRASWSYLENWSILEKDAVRLSPRAFLADDCIHSRMFHEHTSGTTGKSLDLWWSRETVRTWYALAEARWRQWYKVSRHDNWAILGGQLITPVYQEKPPFWAWNRAMHQLYMSSYHLSPRFIPYYFDALEKYKIRYLLGYTSSLYAIAQEALRLGRDNLRFTVAITNAEPVFDYQRRVIEEAFHCPVRETYGMSEIVAAAGECESGRLHLWPEVGWIEILEGDQALPVGETGEIVATGFLNSDMPLVRYRVGDRAALAVQEFCECGRTLPQLQSIEGRNDDVLYTRDGRRIGRLDPIFKTELPILEAQIVQEQLDRIRVRLAPAPGYNPHTGQVLIDRIKERFGDVTVVLEELEKVPRTSNGKFRAVICQIPVEERMRIAKNQ